MNLVAQKYRAVEASTSSPGKLLVLLYEGLLRFLGEAKEATERGDRARAGERISRALDILGELLGTLDAEQAPELCENLSALYVFAMNQLVEANLQRDAAKIEQVRGLLVPLRDAWKIAVADAAKAPSP